MNPNVTGPGFGRRSGFRFVGCDQLAQRARAHIRTSEEWCARGRFAALSHPTRFAGVAG
jgi:hypothetical protein